MSKAMVMKFMVLLGNGDVIHLELIVTQSRSSRNQSKPSAGLLGAVNPRL